MKVREGVKIKGVRRKGTEVWETLKREAGRVVLTNKGQPAYLLVDLNGHDVVSLINKFDSFNKDRRVKVTQATS